MTKEALAQPEQLMNDQINYGISVTQGGKRIDPMSIYKEREQDGKCKYCIDGCPACDARKLPEQEPVAYINVEQRKLEWAKYMSWDTPTVVNLPKIPLYTTPPQRTWVGLTDEEIKALAKKHNGIFYDCDIDFARAVEAKFKEKNT
jgi:hypothetical protein